MKDVVLDEVMKELKWKERVIVKIFKKTFDKVYNTTRIKLVNIIIK